MPILTLTLCDKLIEGVDLKTEFSAALNAWTKQANEFPPELPQELSKTKIQISARQGLILNDLAARHRVTADDLASRILFYAEGASVRSSGGDFSEVMRAMNLSAYTEQLECASNFEHITTLATVGLVEAATGLGKTNVTAFRGLSNILEDRGRTLIAVPSIQIAHQTIAAISRMQACWPAAKTVSANILLGRQEFVWVESVQSYLLDSGCAWTDTIRLAVSSWIAKGGQGATDAYPAWTIDGLERHILRTTGEEFHLHPAHRLDHTDHCKYASPVHQAQFQSEADISVITHMMLGRDLTSLIARGRKAAKSKPELSTQGFISQIADPLHTPEWRQTMSLENTIRLAALDEKEGKLPEWSNLIIDEGHLFRANLSLSTSTDISILHLLRQLETLSAAKRKLVPAESLREVRKILSTVRLWGSQVENLPVDEHQPATIDGFEHTLEKLVSAIPDIKAADIPENLTDVLWKLRRARMALSYALKTKDRGNTTISWSPVKQLPSIVVHSTETAITQMLDLLWQHAKSCIILSATLTTPEATGPSYTYIRRLLALDTRKDVVECRPIFGTWLSEPVTLHMPAKTNTTLNPQKESDDPKWLDAVARQVIKASRSSSLGILVLSCSRKTTQGLRSALEQQSCPNPIIDSNGRHLTRAFREFTRDDHRLPPIWIAHGPAWTGLDIPSGKLDCLILPRLPFRPPPSASARAAKWTLRFNSQEMTIRLRQGIGRLVRQRITDAQKHLWILDPRVHRQMPRTILAPYKRRKAIMPS